MGKRAEEEGRKLTVLGGELLFSCPPRHPLACARSGFVDGAAVFFLWVGDGREMGKGGMSFLGFFFVFLAADLQSGDKAFLLTCTQRDHIDSHTRADVFCCSLAPSLPQARRTGWG